MKGITMAQWINLFRNNRFILEAPITFSVRIIGPIHIAEPGLTVGRQACGWQVADEIQVNLEIFKNHCKLKDSTFCFFNQGTVSLQQ